MQTLHHLCQKYQADPTLGQPLQQPVQVARGVVVDFVAAQVGNFPRRLVGRHAFSQAAQVLDQDHPKRGRKRPHLAEIELAGLLVRQQKLHQQVLVERTVRMRHKCPCNAVNPRQSGQRLILQHRQGPEIAPWQAFVDFLGLRANQVKVIQQPFCGRADVKPGAGLHADKTVCQAQHFNVALQAWKEIGHARPAHPGPVRLAQAEAVLCKPLGTKNFGPDRGQQRAALHIQNIEQQGGRLRHPVF